MPGGNRVRLDENGPQRLSSVKCSEQGGSYSSSNISRQGESCLPQAAGENPATPRLVNYARLAQLVEQRLPNPLVGGSSPSPVRQDNALSVGYGHETSNLVGSVRLVHRVP